MLRLSHKCGLKRVSPTSSEIDLIISISDDIRDTRVDLSDRDLTAASMKVVASMLKHNKGLRELNMGYNNIGDKGLKYLVHVLTSTAEDSNIHDLDLSYCGITDAGMKWCGLSPWIWGAPAFVHAVSTGHVVPGCEMLANLLRDHKTIVSVNLSNNSISDAGALLLRQAMKKNKDLDTVDLEGNDVTEGMLTSIRDENLATTPPPQVKIAPIVNVRFLVVDTGTEQSLLTRSMPHHHHRCHLRIYRRLLTGDTTLWAHSDTRGWWYHHKSLRCEFAGSTKRHAWRGRHHRGLARRSAHFR